MVAIRPAALTIYLVGALLFLTGCTEPHYYPEVVYRDHQPSLSLPTAPTLRHSIAGRSVLGRPITATILGKGPDTILILATIHGNEPAGTPLVRHLQDYLQEHPHLIEDKTIVLVAVANPDGMAQNTRYNARGVDLNRNFATSNRIDNARFGQRALSEPESRILETLIQRYSPSRIVSIHQPLACIDYDGPGRDLAEQMAEYCDLPVKKLGARPGSLGSYAGVEMGTPIVTMELLTEDSSLTQQSLWRRYGNALLAAIAYPDTVLAE